MNGLSACLSGGGSVQSQTYLSRQICSFSNGLRLDSLLFLDSSLEFCATFKSVALQSGLPTMSKWAHLDANSGALWGPFLPWILIPLSTLQAHPSRTAIPLFLEAVSSSNSPISTITHSSTCGSDKHSYQVLYKIDYRLQEIHPKSF